MRQAERRQSGAAAALASEKESLRKEVANWKKRVTSLTASFNAVGAGWSWLVLSSRCFFFFFFWCFDSFMFYLDILMYKRMMYIRVETTYRCTKDAMIFTLIFVHIDIFEVEAIDVRVETIH